MIRLQGLKGCHDGSAFEFDKDTVVVGRSSSGDLAVDDDSCSRRHAIIQRVESGFHIRDLGSTNGIRVNGKKVRESPLQYGDRFSIGRNLFIFLAQVAGGADGERVEKDGGAKCIDDTVSVGDIDNRITRKINELTQVFKTGTEKVSTEELEGLQRTHQQMHFVYRVSRALNSTLEKSKLFDVIINSIFDEFRGTDRVAIFIADATDPQALKKEVAVGQNGPAEFPVSQYILERVEEERVGVLAGNAHDEEDYNPCEDSAQLSTLMCVPLLIGVKYLGAIYVETCTRVHSFGKSDLELLTVLANQAATAIGNALLYDELQVSFYETVLSLSNALEAKDTYTRGHSDRVARYAVGIGEKLSLDADRLRTLKVAAELHDIGKIAINEAIIGKNGGLTDEEYNLVRRHPELGVEILRPIRFLKPALPIVLHHHERFDGTGYPCRLAGDSIPMEARILNLADAFDAMTTKRPYNKPLSADEALQSCMKEAGRSFDPDCVEAFAAHLAAERGSLLEESAEEEVGIDGAAG